MRLVLLGSGSSGNVAYVECGPTRLLIDAGLPKAEIERRLQRVPGPVGVADLDAILVTHDHSDHAGCADKLGRPIHATDGTRRIRGWSGTSRVLAGRSFTVGSFTVHPVLLPHDAEETVGYVLEAEGARVGILTDCGHDAPEVAEAYAGCDLLVLETNHDQTLLSYGPYPPSLKRRVGGRRGHLSNDQAASLLRAMMRQAPAPKLVVAAHLSQANNRPQLAKSALDRVLGREGRVRVATQAGGTPIFAVSPSSVAVEPDRSEQLAFDLGLGLGLGVGAEAQTGALTAKEVGT